MTDLDAALAFADNIAVGNCGCECGIDELFCPHSKGAFKTLSAEVRRLQAALDAKDAEIKELRDIVFAQKMALARLQEQRGTEGR